MEKNYWTELKVTPSNWNTPKADIDRLWVIWYRFYCPDCPKGHQVKIRGMNRDKTRKGRQKLTRDLIDSELSHLVGGYNPFTAALPEPEPINFNAFLSPAATWLHALEFALQKKEGNPAYLENIKSNLKHLCISAKNAGMETLRPSEVSKKHMKILFEQLAKDKKEVWSANLHNVFIANISSLFSMLVDPYEIIETNPLIGFKKKAHIVAEKKPLTPEDIELINEYLPKWNYPFWRMLQLYFHSGSRATEFVRLQTSDIDLQNQYCSFIVKKGGKRRVKRVIPDAAVDWWREVLQASTPGDYVFSAGWLPGKSLQTTRMFRDAWEYWIQGELGIKGVGGYILKHMHSQLMDDLIGSKLAAKHNAHDVSILKKHYATSNEQENDIIRKAKIKLG